MSFFDIIKREAREEIGDDVNFEIKPKPIAIGRHFIPAKFNSEDIDIKVMYIFFEGVYNSGEVVIRPEHIAYNWVDIKKENPEEYFKSGILEAVKMYLNE